MSDPVVTRSTELFNRQIALSIGPKDGEGFLIQDLRITFRVEKSLEKAPNPASIEITNPSKATLSTIENIPVNGPNGPVVILQCGYNVGDDYRKLPIVFQGDIAKLTIKKTGPDIIATIEAGDGEQSYLNSTSDLSFGKGSSFGNVLDSITGSLGLSKGQQVGVNRDDTFLNGISLSGNTRDHLDELTKRQGLIWSIQNGQLQLIPADGSTTQETVVLTPETGLIGSPFRTKIIRTTQDKKPQISGLKFLSLLNSDLQPGRPVLVVSQNQNGVYRIEKVTHSGDTHGQTWYSEVEVR